MPELALPPRTETLGIRTEHMRIAKANGGGMVGRVRRVEHLGDQNHVHLEYRGQTMVTLADPHQPLAAGEDVGFCLSTRSTSMRPDGASQRPFSEDEPDAA